jgi:putative two-component system response regulator
MNTSKILVVEDDSNISELIRITLLSPLYDITCVDTGAEALAKLSGDKPDLIVLDILIPEPDGWEIYRAIRSNPELAHARVIILTALLFSQEFLRTKKILATDIVMKKPFEIDELRIKTKDLLAPW